MYKYTTYTHLANDYFVQKSFLFSPNPKEIFDKQEFSVETINLIQNKLSLSTIN